MRKTVGMLALFLTIILILPGLAAASEDHPRKYGVDFQFGSSYYLMQNVNDFIPPDPGFTGYEPDKINIGTQLGIGISYRIMENFGYQFGYNVLAAGVPVVLEQKYSMTATFPGAISESWAEQTVSGWELSAMAVWYKAMGSSEMSFGIGPAMYKASLDRSIDIVRDVTGSHFTSGSFHNAQGKAFGLIMAFGFEIPMGSSSGLLLQAGGRLAKIHTLTYDDPEQQISDKTVYLNAGTGAPLGVDFSGGFFKVTLRSYFQVDEKGY